MQQLVNRSLRSIALAAFGALAILCASPPALAQQKKPNILVI